MEMLPLILHACPEPPEALHEASKSLAVQPAGRTKRERADDQTRKLEKHRSLLWIAITPTHPPSPSFRARIVATDGARRCPSKRRSARGPRQLTAPVVPFLRAPGMMTHNVSLPEVYYTRQARTAAPNEKVGQTFPLEPGSQMGITPCSCGRRPQSSPAWE